MNKNYNKVELNDAFCPDEMLIRQATAGLLKPQLGYLKFSFPDSNSPMYPWSYQFQYDGSNEPTVNNLYCFNKSHFNVCDLIKWHDVQINLSGHLDSPSITLPLRGDYLLSSFSVSGGRIVENLTEKPKQIHLGKVPLWQLPLIVDKGFLLLFGYQFDNEAQLQGYKPPSPIPSEALTRTNSRSFQPRAEQLLFDPSLALGATPKRFLVGVEFICCGPSADYEPLGILTVARFYPLLWVASNFESCDIVGKITISRPWKSSCPDEKMGDMHPALYADSNSGVPTTANWDDLFDYYLINPWYQCEASKCRYRVVDPSAARERSTLPSDSWRYRYATAAHGSMDYEEPTSVTKVPRQGEFDNIHIAPYLIHPGFRHTLFELISMAPVCMHDCLHAHFRWGSMFDKVPALRGWGFDDKTQMEMPHIGLGSPLVPSNHRVDIQLTSKPGFVYEATVIRQPSYKWACINHHGLAYGLGIGKATSFSGRAVKWLLPSSEADWPEFYHSLRFRRRPDGFPRQRIQLRDKYYSNTLDKLRKL